MAKRSRPSSNKRQKERARQEHRQSKLERRAQRQIERQQRSAQPITEDPAPAGILPEAHAEPVDESSAG